jgi:hypothetical protein
MKALHRETSFASLAFDEWWDVEERMQELAQQRERLSELLLAWSRASGDTRLETRRAALRVERYAELRVWNLPKVIGILPDSKLDEVLRVDGRKLHKLASTDAALMHELLRHATPVQREGLAIARRPRG